MKYSISLYSIIYYIYFINNLWFIITDIILIVNLG